MLLTNACQNTARLKQRLTVDGVLQLRLAKVVVAEAALAVGTAKGRRARCAERRVALVHDLRIGKRKSCCRS